MRYPTPSLWRVRVIEAHDGDTIKVLVDRGSDDYSTWDIRLKDVYAPELSMAGGYETLEFANNWLLVHKDGSEWPFLLETFRTSRSDRDVKTFSRYVGRLFCVEEHTLNLAVQEYVEQSGWAGGIGS